MNFDFETAQEALAFFTLGKAWLDVLEVLENRPKERLDEVGGAHFVGVCKGVARRRANAKLTQGCRFEAQPVTDVVETDSMGKLGKEHGRQVAQNAESSGLCFHASFAGRSIKEVSRNEVEKLL